MRVMKEECVPETRRVRQVLKSRATIEGAGVHLHRAIGFGPPEQYDPFLLLDDFRSDDPDEYVHSIGFFIFPVPEVPVTQG